MSREAEALKRWLNRAWELGVDVAEIARMAEEGVPMGEIRHEAEQRLGMSEPVSAWLDSFPAGASRPDMQPKPRGSGQT